MVSLCKRTEEAFTEVIKKKEESEEEDLEERA
jgi:hypothetical protein